MSAPDPKPLFNFCHSLAGHGGIHCLQLRRMQYTDSRSWLDTPKKILKVNHAGEFGAVNIYKAQILVAKLFRRNYVDVLESFKKDEERHLAVFWEEIERQSSN